MFNTFSNKKRGEHTGAFPKMMIRGGIQAALIYNPPQMNHIFRGIVLIGPNLGEVLKLSGDLEGWRALKVFLGIFMQNLISLILAQKEMRLWVIVTLLVGY